MKNTKYDYGYEQLTLTINILSTHSGGVKERLLDAFISRFTKLKSGNGYTCLPKNLYTEFENIYAELTSIKPIGDEGDAQATIKKMTIEKAQEYAERIFAMYHDFVTNHYKK